MLTEATSTCETCEEPIYLYCHSQAGRIRALAWTDVDPDGDIDPRYGTRCVGFTAHVPEGSSEEGSDDWTEEEYV